MGAIRSLMFAAAVIGGGAMAVGSASAAPVPAGAVAAAEVASPVEAVQWGGWGYGYGPRYGYYGPRRYYGPRYGFYGPRRYWGGPPVVCRYRPSPWGPRRVCFRRY